MEVNGINIILHTRLENVGREGQVTAPDTQKEQLTGTYTEHYVS